MSHAFTPRRVSTAAAAIVALALALAGALSPGAHAATAAQAALSTSDAGAYYVFRTRDTGAPATSAQNKRCNNHFGVRSLTTITRLNALLFSFDTNPATGRLENQTASLLGPGFLCGVPALGRKGTDVDAYAYSSLPGAGFVEGTGGCGIAPVVVKDYPLILNCALGVKKDATQGITGGMITSNSLINTLNRSASAPTGSVWTAHVSGSNANTGGEPGTIPPGIKPETPGLDFFVTRTRDEIELADSPECRRAGLAAKPLAVRQLNLAVAQPDLASGRVPDAAGPSVAKMTVCYAYVSNIGYRAFAITDLRTSTGTFVVRAGGDCKTLPAAAGAGIRSQACSLSVTGGPAKGLVTSNSLIETGKPASAANSGVWTFALFGAPAGG